MQRSLQMVRYYFNVKQWTPTQSQWLKAGECVQEEERKRMNEFVFKEDNKTGLIGRLLMRYALCKTTGVPWGDIKLSRTEKGKPILDFQNSTESCKEKLSKIAFNISHSGDFVVAVTDRSPQLGVDVMNVRDRHGDTTKFFDIMTRNFSEREWTCIKQQSDDKAKMKMFYRHWCLKESFVKAIGKGIGYSLQKLSFDVDPKSEVCPQEFHVKTKLEIEGVETNNWIFEESMIDENHCVAIATDITGLRASEVSHPFTEVLFSDFEPHFQQISSVTDEFWTDFNKKPSKNR